MLSQKPSSQMFEWVLNAPLLPTSFWLLGQSKKLLKLPGTADCGKCLTNIKHLLSLFPRIGGRMFYSEVCKAFLKTKRSSGTSLASFCHNFWREIFLLLHSINRPNFIVCLPLICEVLAICVLQLFVNQVVTS